jgi:hypothetical protein
MRLRRFTGRAEAAAEDRLIARAYLVVTAVFTRRADPSK